jgi:hypothetical protein
LQTNLIAYNSHATEVKEWFYYAENGKARGEANSKADRQEGQRLGPVSKDELKTLFYKGKVKCNVSLSEAFLEDQSQQCVDQKVGYTLSFSDSNACVGVCRSG